MKRPPGLWLLLTTVLVWLCIEEVYSIKATSLIFGKTTTTTTTAPASENAEESVAESTASSSNVTEDAQSGQNTTKLTGIPQIDYIYDPNLPRELNGYNLSSYPFYDRVPEDIVFKCDGLHDGFYASVPHKCQVYHHCLFGTRYDFLCANYTAFDQKTFICHFVSEVDCVNSKKFWHRNDALYQAASTTTPKPVVIQTPPPAPATSVPIVPLLQRRPLGGGRRRRPQRRRRPEYDYYEYEDEDEFYDEPRRRKRPRYRPRPVYDDEYDEEYEEDTYDRRRRPYNRRRNNNERRRYEDEDYEEEDDRNGKKRPPNNRSDKRPAGKRRPADDEDDYETRAYDRPRKGGQRRPADDEYEDEKSPKEERRSYDRPRKNQDQEDGRSRDRPEDTRRRPHDESRRYDEGRRGYDRPRQKNQDESRKFDRPRKDGEDNYEDKLDEDKPAMIKPVGGSSVYGKPRAPPRIRPPVPKSEQNKFSYKTVSMSTSTKPPVDEEYYEDYEEEDPPKYKKPEAEASTAGNSKTDDLKNTKQSEEYEEEDPPKYDNKKPEAEASTAGNSKTDDLKNTKESEGESVSESKDVVDKKDPKEGVRNFRENRRPPSSRRGQPSRRPPQDDDYFEEEVARRPNKPENDRRIINSSVFRRRPENNENKSPVPVDEERDESTTTIASRERSEPVIKVLKRPFLPSRGGNPYLPRGLQPVGAKAESDTTEEDSETQKMTESRKLEDTKTVPEPPAQEPRVKIIKTNREGFVAKQTEAPPLIEITDEAKPFKPSPVVVKIPIRNKYLITTNDEEFRPASNRAGVRQNVRVKEAEAKITEKPQINPLDIDENEYDVTLNDALNPTLPNLPVRGFPTGFSAPNEYTYNAYQRSRYVVDPTLNQASSDYVYAIKQPVQQNYNSGGNQFESTLRYNAPTTYQNFRPSPQVTHAQAQPFYASY